MHKKFKKPKKNKNIRRRHCRILVVKMIYEYEMSKNKPEEIYNYYIDESIITEKSKEFIKSLFFKCIENLKSIDKVIEKYLVNWKIDRLITIDKCIMRMGITELLWHNEGTPSAIVINESVEIAKMYGTVNSSKMVNAILDRIAKNKEKLLQQL